ncbi:hypothetical protein [Seonamhaeicola aphaedonensis]|uniref:DUF3108 domain-containing protein n=1 Tax=Seonamhaeicola aphaedonensis TaxID=1461338 RepID=A0A3D9HH02_9FLAO|nr:hypothetical protein [Seonamhaeicola aphaedonensis]RED48812.1 hypothetical protein DFQ02_103142 [Seonamhaeicola aphaedonensis]
MKKYFIILIALAIHFPIALFSQETFNDGIISIEYFETEQVSNKLNLNSSTKIRGEGVQKISVKCKIKSLNKQRIDINKFSLVDTINKLRYRPTDVSYQPVAGYMVYGKLLKSDIKKKGLVGHYSLGASYKPEVKDSFLDYNIEGYTNIEPTFNFWTDKDPLLSKIYFKPHKFKKFKALFFFAIIKDAPIPNLALYYGDNKVTDIRVK